MGWMEPTDLDSKPKVMIKRKGTPRMVGQGEGYQDQVSMEKEKLE
jgi:hypothetical protein